jgi:hypothetical protein
MSDYLPIAEWNGWKLMQICNWVVARHPGQETRWFFKPHPAIANTRYHQSSMGQERWLDQHLPKGSDA